jgi:hypothetical protein
MKAVFMYTSVCCEAPARKAPCERVKEDRKEGKFSESSLGHWHCVKCKQGCKVKRSRNAE